MIYIYIYIYPAHRRDGVGWISTTQAACHASWYNSELYLLCISRTLGHSSCTMSIPQRSHVERRTSDNDWTLWSRHGLYNAAQWSVLCVAQRRCSPKTRTLLRVHQAQPIFPVSLHRGAFRGWLFETTSRLRLASVASALASCGVRIADLNLVH